MNNEIISVIIIVYNTEKYISECLNSIINQTYKYLDIVVVNDGSTDNSSLIINEYVKKDKRINFINRCDNHGTMYTRIEGYNNAKGKYITFIDSDDFLKLDAIEKMYDNIIAEKVDIVKCNFVRYKDGLYYNNKNAVNSNLKICKDNFDSTLYNLLFKTIYLNSMCGNLVKKEYLTCIKDIDPDLIYAEDILCNFYMYKNINSLYINSEELYVYRANDNSITNSIDDNKLTKKISDALKCYREIYNEIDHLNLNNYSLYKNIIQEKVLNVISNALLTYVKILDVKRFNKIYRKIRNELFSHFSYQKYKYKNYLKNNILLFFNNKFLINNNVYKFYFNSKIIILIKQLLNK